jgi:Bacteriophage HK97-gp10, putative tail-component
MAGLDVKAHLSPQWRTLEGRFAKADVGGELAKIVQAWGQQAVTELKQATPRRTGAMQRSWRADYLPSSRSVKVANARPYAMFLITGTQPHDIPRAFGRPLPFGIGGRFGDKFHPGTKPDPRLEAAVERLEQSAAVDLHQAGIEIIKQITEG